MYEFKDIKTAIELTKLGLSEKEIKKYFNFENKIRNSSISKSIKFLGENKIVNKFFTKVADKGIVI